MERDGGAHEPMRCTFKLARGRNVFTFFLILPTLTGRGDWGGVWGVGVCLSGFF